MHRTLVAIGLMLSLPSAALASQITVQDCNGTVRWAGELTEHETSANLLVTLDPESSLTLRRAEMKSSSGTHYTGVVRGEEIQFDEVGEGVFKLCSPEGDFIPFLTVTKSPAGESATGILASAGLIGLAALGTVSAVDASDSSNNSSRGGAGSGSDAPASIANPPTAPAQGGGFDPEDFNLGAPAAPLSPYQ